MQSLNNANWKYQEMLNELDRGAASERMVVIAKILTHVAKAGAVGNDTNSEVKTIGSKISSKRGLYLLDWTSRD